MGGVLLPLLVALCFVLLFGKCPTEGSAEIAFAAAFIFFCRGCLFLKLFITSFLAPTFSFFPTGL